MSLKGVGGNLEPRVEHWYQGCAAMSPFDAELQNRLDDLEAEGLRRTLRRVESGQGREIQLDGRRVLNFASNDYLGLTQHPDVIAGGVTALHTWGAGSGGSRLVTGNTELKHLERLIRLLTIQKQILEEDETAEPSAIPDELQPFVWWLQ